MKRVFGSILLFCLLAQAQAENYVLDLDGQGDYVRLPSQIFLNLTEATIEFRAKWHRFNYFSQIFGVGKGWRNLGVNTFESSGCLQFHIYESQSRLHLIRVETPLQLGRWYHVAAVTGPAGMKLYLDGELVGTNAYTGSFASLANSDFNFLGRSLWIPNQDFCGQLDEVRVWSTARSPEEIRSAMNGRLRGDEHHLAALWNFDSGDARDASRNGYHGRLAGDAHSAPETEPQLSACRIAGRILTDSAVLPSVKIRLFQNGELFLETIQDGHFTDRFQLDFVVDPKARYLLSASSGDLGTWKDELRLQPETTTAVDLKLKPSIHIVGTVSALDGSPHPAVPVQAIYLDDNVTGALCPGLNQTTLTDANGAYRLVNLCPGRYVLRCQVQGGFVYFRQQPPVQSMPIADPEVDPEVFGTPVAIGAEDSPLQVDFRFAAFKNGRWRTLTRLDGLPSNRVNAIFQDRAGLMWLGTDEGAVSFDGETFTHFSTRDGLIGDDVTAIHQDSAGLLWFGTLSGVSRFDGKKFVNFGREQGLSHTNVLCIETGRDGDLLFGTLRNVTRYQGGRFEPFLPNPLFGDCVITSIHRNKDHIWYGSEFGYDLGGLIFDNGHQSAGFWAKDGLVNNRLNVVREGPDGSAWIGTHDGLSRFDGNRFAKWTVENGLPYQKVTALHVDRDGVVWLGTGKEDAGRGAVTRFDGKTFVHYTPRDGLAAGLIQCIYRDTSGQLWFGTRNAGLSIYDPDTVQVFSTRHGLPDHRISALLRSSDGSLWVGTDQGGLARWDGTNFVTFTNKDGLASHQITAVHEDLSQEIWAGTKGGLHRFRAGRWHQVTAEEVNAIADDRDGTLWVASQNALDSGGIARRLPWGFEAWVSGGPGDRPVRTMGRSREGDVWMATSDCVFRFDGQHILKIPWALLPSAGVANVVYGDWTGTIWIGTSKGLARFENGALHVLPVPELQGHRDVRSIHRDQAGRLWIGTLGGVAIFDGSAWCTLETADGLAGRNVVAIQPAEGDSVWLATDGGLTRFRRSSTKPAVRIISVKTDQPETDPGHIAPITAGTRITIAYRAIDFESDPQRRQYRRRLLHSTDKSQTRDAGGEIPFGAPVRENVFEFAPRDPGRYTFEVQAIDRDLNYSQPASFSIDVNPPWYLNAWVAVPFGGSIGVLLLIVSVFGPRYFFHRREARRLQARLIDEERHARARLEEKSIELEAAKQAAEAANQAKTLFLANMSHEIRTPLHAILGYAQLLQNKTHLPPDARQALQTIEQSGVHLLHVINEILDLSKIEAGRLEVRSNAFDLVEFVASLSTIFQSSCEQKGLNWQVEWRSRGARTLAPPVWLVIGDESKLRQILMNLLANAVKFTDRGSVLLRIDETAHASVGALETSRESSERAHITAETSRVTFSVLDTGRGISPSELNTIFEPFSRSQEQRRTEGTGLGLAIARRYVDALGGKLEVESILGQGSCFSFAIPFAPAPLSLTGSGKLEGAETGRRITFLEHPTRSCLACLVPGSLVRAWVVDDQLENRKVLEGLLTEMGVRTKALEDVQPALEALRQNPPDVVFLDIWMPGMDGLQTARRIRRDMPDSPIKLVAVSASALLEEQKQCIAAGFDAFLAKPVQAAELRECLVRLLDVEFQKSGAANETDFSGVRLPGTLLNEMKAAAEIYSTSELMRHLTRLEKLEPQAARLAEVLRRLNQQSDMDGILELLSKVNAHDEPQRET